MSLDYSIIGERLKKARIKKGYTQEELSELIDVSVAFLSRVECGNTKINLSRLDQICEILGVTHGYILDGASEVSHTYLNKEFSDLLKSCPSEKIKLIYEISKIIINS